jgi:hypothetical protein
MSDALLRTLEFGDLEAGVWGYASAPADGPAFAHAGRLEGDRAVAPLAAAALEPGAPGEPWLLRAGLSVLTFEPLGEPAAIGAEGENGDAFAQLCRVSGEVTTGGNGGRGVVEVGCLGLVTLTPVPDDGFDSVRAVSGWFSEGDGFAVASIRPRRARGHDRDRLEGVLFESGSALPIVEPRLSTTYDGAGLPARAGLELWLTSGEEEPDEDANPAMHFPRRAAGEALGAAAAAVADAAAALPGAPRELRADLFRWHLRGHEGVGFYRRLLSRSA